MNENIVQIVMYRGIEFYIIEVLKSHVCFDMHDIYLAMFFSLLNRIPILA